MARGNPRRLDLRDVQAHPEPRSIPSTTNLAKIANAAHIEDEMFAMAMPAAVSVSPRNDYQTLPASSPTRKLEQAEHRPQCSSRAAGASDWILPGQSRFAQNLITSRAPLIYKATSHARRQGWLHGIPTVQSLNACTRSHHAKDMLTGKLSRADRGTSDPFLFK